MYYISSFTTAGNSIEVGCIATIAVVVVGDDVVEVHKHLEHMEE